VNTTTDGSVTGVASATQSRPTRDPLLLVIISVLAGTLFVTWRFATNAGVAETACRTSLEDRKTALDECERKRTDIATTLAEMKSEAPILRLYGGNRVWAYRKFLLTRGSRATFQLGTPEAPAYIAIHITGWSGSGNDAQISAAISAKGDHGQDVQDNVTDFRAWPGCGFRLNLGTAEFIARVERFTAVDTLALGIAQVDPERQMLIGFGDSCVPVE